MTRPTLRRTLMTVAVLVPTVTGSLTLAGSLRVAADDGATGGAVGVQQESATSPQVGDAGAPAPPTVRPTVGPTDGLAAGAVVDGPPAVVDPLTDLPAWITSGETAPANPLPQADPPAPTGPVDNTVVRTDSLGMRLDAHDGDLLQAPDGTTYLYGTSYGCGFTLGKPSPYCGVRVYSTTDLSTFVPAGAVGGLYAFDHLAGPWQALCAPTRSYGCYRPHVVQRPADGRYVMWVNTHHDAGYKVLVAEHPAGPFVDTGLAPELAIVPPPGGLRYGDHDLTVDPVTGHLYVTYTVIWANDNTHQLVVERLDPSGTTGTGEFVQLAAMAPARELVEAPALFRAPTGTWHMVFSDPARPYRTTGSGIMDAPGPLGPWTNRRTLSADSCGGQPAGVWPVRTSTGRTAYVYGSDRWDEGKGNQAAAENYYGELTFTARGGTSIDAHRCQSTWTLR
ncbi:family 43 glycosylhydrolase [Cellulomonas carbonis]|uniref:Glycoside hydrolase n=1 Tax=Cellulomonas carbonis T26 TaxID=947969 RepID=A0A0A0BNP8_9CELL|nr:family 43 glycosylhydrolase [Cellulomonas carbonis]KGM09575.1 hypothetical protein N868_01480 [Cellulomonas carbonis T26]GGC07437.1 hypothetical protein GCM10010972_20960 [Cellulomonas carbonis]